MECAICNKKFFTPKSQEELEKIYKENVKKNDYGEIMKFYNLLITSKHNTTHSCSTPNCHCLICGDCWCNITYKVKGIDEINEDDISSINNIFECPYCRQIDLKYYMNNVFNELQQKVLGEKEFIAVFYKRCFPEFDE